MIENAVTFSRYKCNEEPLTPTGEVKVAVKEGVCDSILKITMATINRQLARNTRTVEMKLASQGIRRICIALIMVNPLRIMIKAENNPSNKVVLNQKSGVGELVPVHYETNF